MDFLLFLITTAFLFLRPQDFVPDLATAPLYLVVLLLTALAASPALLGQFSVEALAKRPITVCVGGVWLAIVLSFVMQGALWEARTSGFEFAKVVLYYLLVVATVTSPLRLNRLLSCLAGFILVITVLALLQYHEVIDIPQITTLQQREIDDDTGEETYTPRLQSLGAFSDPNDLSLILVVGIGIAVYRLNTPGAGLRRLPWLALCVVLVYALALTQSRGGFLAFLLGMFVLFRARFGWWKAFALAGCALPVMLVLFGGRQTEISTQSNTGQDRIQLWSEAFELFRTSPLFGIGQGQFQEEVGLVTHNSYLHCFTELGLLGGCCFLGAFFTALWTLVRLGKLPTAFVDPELRRLRPYLIALIAGYASGMMSLSRSYICPTYLMLGLATSYGLLATRERSVVALPTFNFGFVQRLAGVSMVFLAGLYVFVRIAITRG